MTLTDELRQRLIREIDLSREISDEELQELITRFVWEEYARNPLPLKEKLKISRELFHSIRGLDILEGILDDGDVTEIMVNGYQEISGTGHYHGKTHKDGIDYKRGFRFSSEAGGAGI